MSSKKDIDRLVHGFFNVPSKTDEKILEGINPEKTMTDDEADEFIDETGLDPVDAIFDAMLNGEATISYTIIFEDGGLTYTDSMGCLDLKMYDGPRFPEEGWQKAYLETFNLSQDIWDEGNDDGILRVSEHKLSL